MNRKAWAAVTVAAVTMLSGCNLGRDYEASDEPMDFEEMMKVISAKSYSANPFPYLSATSVDYVDDIPAAVAAGFQGALLGRFATCLIEGTTSYYDLRDGRFYDGLLPLGTIYDKMSARFFDMPSYEYLASGNAVALYLPYADGILFDGAGKEIGPLPQLPETAAFIPESEGQVSGMAGDNLVVTGRVKVGTVFYPVTLRTALYGNSVPELYDDELPDMIPYDYNSATRLGIDGYIKDYGWKMEIYGRGLNFRNVFYLNSMSDSTDYYAIGGGKFLTVESLDPATGSGFGKLPVGTQKFHSYNLLTGEETTRNISGWLVGYSSSTAGPQKSSFSLEIDYNADNVVDGILLPAVSYDQEGLGQSDYYIWVEPDGHVRGGFRWNGSLPGIPVVSIVGQTSVWYWQRPIGLPDGSYLQYEGGAPVVSWSNGQQNHAFDGLSIVQRIGKRGFAVRDSAGMYGFVDFGGEEIVPREYTAFIPSSDYAQTFASTDGDFAGTLFKDDGSGVMLANSGKTDLVIPADSTITSGAVFAAGDVYSHNGEKIGVLNPGYVEGSLVAGGQSDGTEYDFVQVDVGNGLGLQAVVVGLELKTF